MRKPHLLYLAFWFPPSRASGVYRALAATRAFVDAGWDVTVITTTEEFLDEEIGSTDRSLLGGVPREVAVVRVPFSFINDARRVNVRRMSWFHGNYPRLWSLWYQLTHRIREALRIMLGRSPGAFALADNYVTWIDPAVASAMKVHHDRPIDAVLATGNPFSSFEIARVVGELSGAPFIVDYRDPWTIDVFTGDDIDFPRGTLETEARVIEGAAASIHVNEPIANAYRAKYPASADRQLVVLNGYDTESLGAIRPSRRGSLTFGILGTVNDRWPLEPIFEAWIYTRANLPQGSRLLLGGHLGYFARSEGNLKVLLPDEDDGFEYVGPIPKNNIADFYSGLDVVIVPVPGGPMVTSGKVFEAAALGIPVICVQAEGGGAREVLADHPLAFFAEPTATSVGNAIAQAAASAAARTEEESRAVRAAMAPLERSASIRRMVEIADEAISQ